MEKGREERKKGGREDREDGEGARVRACEEGCERGGRVDRL